jgi:hypothetical protein
VPSAERTGRAGLRARWPGRPAKRRERVWRARSASVAGAGAATGAAAARGGGVAEGLAATGAGAAAAASSAADAAAAAASRVPVEPTLPALSQLSRLGAGVASAAAPPPGVGDGPRGQRCVAAPRLEQRAERARLGRGRWPARRRRHARVAARRELEHVARRSAKRGKQRAQAVEEDAA